MSSPSQSDTTPETPPAHEDTSSGIRGLADTAQTLGSSVQAMQQVLLGNLQQAALMTSSMNQMMEELVRRAIHTTVDAQSAPHGCSLHVRVHNRSPVPLSSLTLRLWFSPRRPLAEALGVRISGTEGALFAGVVGDEVMSAGSEEEVSVKYRAQTSLASGAVCDGKLHLEVARPLQIAARISVGFASPGTGQTLAVENRFGIHLSQLMRCAFAADDGSLEADVLEDTEMLDLDLAAARTVFAIPPAVGIVPGTLLTAAFGQHRLVLRVTSVSDDLRSARCQWLTSDADLIPLIPALSEELSVKPE
ncbi:hypothetical protein IW150_003291 [Coemansia sp. RSA 2607]|nr:hypothetical protein IW150_003291 [Coemansia sp. RSA 2607]